MNRKFLQYPASGDQVIVLVDSKESGGEIFGFEYVANSVTTSPPDHRHSDQEQHVEVPEGTVRCRVSGQERELGPGETLTIPRGVYHAVWNSNPSGSRSVGEFRPAGDTQATFEVAFDGD